MNFGLSGGDDSSSTSIKKTSTVNRNIAAADNAVVVSPNATGRNSRINYGEDNDIRLGRNATLSVTNTGLGANEVSDILNGIQSTIAAGLGGVGTPAPETLNAAIESALAARTKEQIENAPEETAAEAKSMKWITVVFLTVVACSVLFLHRKKKTAHA